jgi:hypothetical protein
MYRAGLYRFSHPVVQSLFISGGARNGLILADHAAFFSLAFPGNAGQEERKPAQPAAVDGE